MKLSDVRGGVQKALDGLKKMSDGLRKVRWSWEGVRVFLIVW